MKVRRPNPLEIGLFSLALLLSVSITLFLYFNLTPWKLESAQSNPGLIRRPAEFRDLNHDGFSEFLEIANNNVSNGSTHYVLFYNHEGAVIDQCNTREFIVPEQIFYGDYTGDGYDECLIFTFKQDSVFYICV
ncbi:MAG: hypothetical protein D6677_08465 [Calditrichaeota bacterium]|nr:MAG: hypothetical protein D6677_08465 [Calditrichota bacterium]